MTRILTATGSTDPGAFSAIATDAVYVPGWATSGSIVTRTVTDSPGSRVVADRLMLIHSTSAALVPQSSNPGSVSLSTVAVKPPDEPPIL